MVRHNSKTATADMVLLRCVVLLVVLVLLRCCASAAWAEGL